MPAYRRVLTLQDAQEVSQSPESYQLDFKSTVDPAAWWELGKDMAAFANHVGGVLLIGAAEQAAGGASLHGIDPATASQLAQAYETIAKDKCSPKLTITCETIDPRLLNGKMLLAVNVDAVPDQLVGAMFYAVDKNGGVKKRFGHVNGSTRMHAASMALRERPPIEPARARARAGRRLSEEAPGIIGLLERPLLTDEEAARLVVSVKSACCNCSRAAACASL